MKKQKINSKFCGLEAEEYFILRESYLMRNQDIWVLSTNPFRFFAEFKRFTKTVPDGLKDACHEYCLKITLERSDAYEKKFLLLQNKERIQKQKKGGEKMKALSSVAVLMLVVFFFIAAPVLADETQCTCTAFALKDGKWTVEQKSFTDNTEAVLFASEFAKGKDRVILECSPNSGEVGKFTFDVTKRFHGSLGATGK